MNTIELQVEKHVHIIKLNRPEKFNSFNAAMAKALLQHLDASEQDPTCRCIVLTGNGKAFCAGQDLSEAIDPHGPGIDHIVKAHYNPIILKLRQIKKPIIAMVNGVAAGAGANIALACDFIIASTQASFIQAFSKIGLIPDSGGTFTLPRIIGMQRASALMMTGDKLSGTEAVQWGLAYKCFDEAEFNAQGLALAQKLAAMPTIALAETKRLLNESWSQPLDMQLEAERQAQNFCSQTLDHQEGVNAFLEKRNPEFKGH